MMSMRWIARLFSWTGLIHEKSMGIIGPHHLSTTELLATAEYERCNEWGSYRGNLYFGMRTRAPHSLLNGLLWFSDQQEGEPNIRHYCSLDDKVDAWGWNEHDGESFGKQTILDSENNARLDVSFQILDQDSWTARIKVHPIVEDTPLSISLVYYIGDEHKDGRIVPEDTTAFSLLQLKGQNQVNGHYCMLLNSTAMPQQMFVLYAPEDSIWDGSTLTRQYLQTQKQNSSRGVTNRSNFAAAHYHIDRSSEIEIHFNRGKVCKAHSFDADKQSKGFRRRFKHTFPQVTSAATRACQFALSNLLGSISYFYGTSYVLQETEIEKFVKETPPFELFTDIPSRATFPRGFLWDSGFHNLILAEWSPKLSLEILQSWANRIGRNGWVAREQVPGKEARRAVPVDYIIQNTRHANPPALLMTLLKLAKRAKASEKAEEKNMIAHRLHHIVPQFEKNLKWLIRTQRGQMHPHFCKHMEGRLPCKRVLNLLVFRWRGRSKYHNLNSGLDDYPRGNFANRYELHVDLATWVAFGARTMLKLYNLLDVHGSKKGRKKFKKIYRRVRQSLDAVHWDEERQLYSDLSISNTGDLTYVQHQGYVNLFPLLFGFIRKDSYKLKATLDLIEDRSRLWTDYGLRSLSLDDSYYMQGDQYWTGPIWININYLVLSSLHTYYLDPAYPHYHQAKRIYDTLRANIVENMRKSFETTGTIWEQYSELDGRGMRSRPFTGWSALLVLIASEQY